MTWSILHIIDFTLWFIIACSVGYVVFFAIISLFYDKEDHLALQAASAKVDLAIQAGKIKPADKENMIAFAKDSSESFDEYIKNAEVIVPLGARKSMKGGDSETNSNGNDVDKQIEDLNAKFGKGE